MVPQPPVREPLDGRNDVTLETNSAPETQLEKEILIG